MEARRNSTAAMLLRPALLLLLLAVLPHESLAANNLVHIAFLTDCSKYSDWQSVGMVFSYKRSRQVGSITRVACCTDEERAEYNRELQSIVETHMAPSFAKIKQLKTGDYYAAYNKPGAVLDWLTHVSPVEDWWVGLGADRLGHCACMSARLFCGLGAGRGDGGLEGGRDGGRSSACWGEERWGAAAGGGGGRRLRRMRGACGN